MNKLSLNRLGYLSLKGFFLSTTLFAIAGFGWMTFRGFALAIHPPQTLERTYFVKGMDCGGCSRTVKKALREAGMGESDILQVTHEYKPSEKMGLARVRFQTNAYQGPKTDCHYVAALKEAGYDAYWDTKNTDPCRSDQK